MRGAPLFSADRGHIHHRLLALGLSHRQAVIVLYAVCALLGSTALAMSFANSGQATWFLVGLSLISGIALWKLGYLRLSSAARLLEERRRNSGMHGAVKRFGLVLRGAQTELEVQRALHEAAAALGATSVSLRDRAEAAAQIFGEEPEQGVERFSARFSLAGERPGSKHLILTWADGRSEVDRDTEIAIETLCQHLSGALDRVSVGDTNRFPVQGA